MRALMLIAASAALAGCSRPVTPPGSSLAQEIAGRVAGPAQSCVSSEPQQNLRIIDAQTIGYGWGRTIYVNHLGAPCPGLQPLSTLIVQPGIGGEYCRGDHVRGREMGAMIPGPVCILGEWIPYRRP